MAVVRRKEARERGLPSLNQARLERQRAFVVGKVRMPGVPMHFWLWTAVGLSLFGIIYWRIAQGQLESARSRVMADQRAMAVALGPKLFPVRDRVEKWAQELAGDFPGALVAPGTDLKKIQTGGTLYLRLRLSSAKDQKNLRKAAVNSLRDGFTSCLFVTRQAGDPTQGAPCRTGGDCKSGMLCNEWNVCVEPQQPFNMRLVYRTLRVLSSDWTDEVHLASSELALAGYQRDLDGVAKRDVPVTVDLLARSKYFTLVLDEDPPGGLPAALPGTDETPEERVQRTAHFARIGIWELKSGQPVLRMRTEAAGEFMMLGRQRAPEPTNFAAQQRQVNSCQMALRVREALGDQTSIPAASP